MTGGFAGLIGVAVGDITPPVGIRTCNWGAATTEVATGVHRPLSVRVVTFQSDPPSRDALVILVVLDLGWWRSPRHAHALRSSLLDELNLPEAHLMVHLTHTHAGPSLDPEERDLPGGDLAAAFAESLAQTICRTAHDALARAIPATLDWAVALCDLAQVRDVVYKGRWVIGPDPGRPERTAPSPVMVGRIRADGPDGRTVATLIHYACHPTTLAWDNSLLSPDYPGALRETVEAATGAPCLFLQGGSGELGPAEGFVGDPVLADRHGRKVGYAALSALTGMPSPSQTAAPDARVVESGAPILVRKTTEVPYPIPLRVSRIAVDLVRKPLRADPGSDAAAPERARRRARLEEDLCPLDPYPLMVTIWRMGDTVFIGIPAEAYSALQTELRTQFPDLAILPLNVTDGWLGYLPPRAAYTDDRYSVRTALFAAGSLEALISQLVRHLNPPPKP